MPAWWPELDRAGLPLPSYPFGPLSPCYAANIKAFCFPSLEIREESATGVLVAQLAISLPDPEEGVREEARGVMTHLCHLLFYHKGLTERKSKLAWPKDRKQPWRDGYIHLHLMGEMFRKHLTDRQRRECLQAAMYNALWPGECWLREASGFLFYSLMGQSQDLLQEQQEKSFRGLLCHRICHLSKNRRDMEEMLERIAPLRHDRSPASSSRRHLHTASSRRLRTASSGHLPPLSPSSITSVDPLTGSSSFYLHPVLPKGCPASPPPASPRPIVWPRPPAVTSGRSLALALIRARAARQSTVKAIPSETLQLAPLDVPPLPDHD